MKLACQRTMLSARRARESAFDLWQQTSGAVALEYGLIAALIAVAIIGSIVELGDALLGLPLESIIGAFVAALT